MNVVAELASVRRTPSGIRLLAYSADEYSYSELWRVQRRKWAVMTLAQHIRSTLEMPMFVVNAYLEDLEDADLFVRPLASMNHLAWQLGHLITSENFHINQVCPGGMPALPKGFADEYSKETAVLDDASRSAPKPSIFR